MKLEDLQAEALQNRPDFRAAVQGVTAAKSQYELAKANGKADITGTARLHHERRQRGLFFRQPPDSDFRPQPGRNRAHELCDQPSPGTAKLAASEQVLSDVLNAYEGVRENDQIIHALPLRVPRCAQKTRDITEYSYKRGAASLLDFLDAERSYRATQLAYRQSLAAI